jgi:WD repeat and SOF domain-containing protein 1
VAVSCSMDCSVRLFRLPFAPFMAAGPVEDEAEATLEFHGKHAFRGIDHHWARNTFATAGHQARALLDHPIMCRTSLHHPSMLVTLW